MRTRSGLLPLGEGGGGMRWGGGGGLVGACVGEGDGGGAGRQTGVSIVLGLNAVKRVSP